MITELLNKRRKAFHKQILKYLRLLFNDQFTILMLFVLGAGGFLYRELLSIVTPQMTLPKLLVSLVLTILVAWGQIPIYTKTADIVFLLPKVDQLRESILTYSRQTLFLKTISLVLGLYVLSPLIRLTSGYQVMEQVMIGILVFVGRACAVYLSYHNKLSAKERLSSQWLGWLYLTIFILTYISLVINPILVSLVGIVFLLFSVWVITQREKEEKFILIESIVLAENKRKQAIYRFFNLVTDVPQVKTQTHGYFKLDGLIKLLAGQSPTRAMYLISHIFTRQPGYRNLILRLTVVGSILCGLSNHAVFFFIFSGLFLLMALIQLVPLAEDVTKRPQVRIHPLSQGDLLKSMQVLCLKVASFMTLLFMLASIFESVGVIFGMLLINISIIFIFNKLYLPRKLPIIDN